MLRQLVKGSTSVILDIFIQDSTAFATTGAGLTGLVFNSASLTCYYHRNTAAVATAVTLVTMTVGAFTSSGFAEIDGTNMPGWYQLCLPNAAFASGATMVSVILQGAANMRAFCFDIELTATDNQDAVRGGMTALPNANAEAAGGLYTRGTGAGQINQTANGIIEADPWNITVPGAYAAGKAGYAVGNLPSAVKKNTALSNFEFLLVDASDGRTPITGRTVTAQRSIDGAAFGACTNGVSEVGGGIYKLNLSAADLNGDTIMLQFSAAGADTRYVFILTKP